MISKPSGKKIVCPYCRGRFPLWDADLSALTSNGKPIEVSYQVRMRLGNLITKEIYKKKIEIEKLEQKRLEILST